MVHCTHNFQIFSQLHANEGALHIWMKQNKIKKTQAGLIQTLSEWPFDFSNMILSCKHVTTTQVVQNIFKTWPPGSREGRFLQEICIVLRSCQAVGTWNPDESWISCCVWCSCPFCVLPCSMWCCFFKVCFLANNNGKYVETIRRN